MTTTKHSVVVLFYKYHLPSSSPKVLHQNGKSAEFYADQLHRWQHDLCTRLRLKGRVLVSTEGINGTLSAEIQSVLDRYIKTMENFDLFRDCGTPSSASKLVDDNDDDDDDGRWCNTEGSSPPPPPFLPAPTPTHPPPSKGRKNQEFRDEHDVEHRHIYGGIDWKMSKVNKGGGSDGDDDDDDGCGDSTVEPFPDLKVSPVREIVSTGGAISVEEIAAHGGTHLSPEQFHEALLGSGNSGGGGDDEEKNVALIDVRNTFEYDIGHFVNPRTGEHAINPETVTFSSFDASFCDRQAQFLKDKKVLMYCTGGIRCEKASAMLRKRGVRNVSQLRGGIHRYLETYGSGGLFRGKNFVFDQRVALTAASSKIKAADKRDPSEAAKREHKNGDNCGDGEEKSVEDEEEIVGRCLECSSPFDEISGSRVCAVCRDLVLICPQCQKSLREYHCRRHSAWKDCYFTFLEVFDEHELETMKGKLQRLRESLVPASEHKNVRRTLMRQVRKVSDRLEDLHAGREVVQRDASRRCRTCAEPEDVCDGCCWGFWKHSQCSSEKRKRLTDPPRPVDVGDHVVPGPHWNPSRLGKKEGVDGMLKMGTVLEVKSWCSGGNGRDSVAVLWNNETDAQIYRWGVLARNGECMYDVQPMG